MFLSFSLSLSFSLHLSLSLSFSLSRSLSRSLALSLSLSFSFSLLALSLYLSISLSFLFHADVENTFYNLAVPPDLSDYFSLGAVPAKLVGFPTRVDGSQPIAGEVLTPYLCVLPMGWSWSLGLCQSMLEGAVEKAGFGRDQLVQDKISGVGIAPGKLAISAYFDKFGVLCPIRPKILLGVFKGFVMSSFFMAFVVTLYRAPSP